MNGLILAAALLFAAAAGPALAAPDIAGATDRIEIRYEAPRTEHQPIHDLVVERRLLEKIREILSPLHLPQRLTLRTRSCRGKPNAWYSEGTVSVCYEFLDWVWKNVPDQMTESGVTPIDAFVGPMVDVFLHEVGHAAFEMLKTPIMGREEDAADQFSVYLMLKFKKDEARRLIMGTAHQYKADVESPTVTTPLTKFADDHGTPAQRFYNVLCIAYGSDPTLFADFVTKGFLPKWRADSCEDEYVQVAYAFDRLIGPYIDPALVAKFHQGWLPPVHARPPRRQ